MLMSHAPLSFQTRQRLQYLITPNMDLTPTNSDEFQELNKILQSVSLPRKPPTQKGAELKGTPIWKYQL